MVPDTIAHFCAYLHRRNYSPPIPLIIMVGISACFRAGGRRTRAVSGRDGAVYRTTAPRPADGYHHQPAASCPPTFLCVLSHRTPDAGDQSQAGTASSAWAAHFRRRCPRSTCTACLPGSPTRWITHCVCSCCAAVCALVKSRASNKPTSTGSRRPYGSPKAKGVRIGSSMPPRTRLRPCAHARRYAPAVVPDDLLFWNQKRPQLRPLSSKGIQKSWSAMPRPPISRRAVIVCGIPLRQTCWKPGLKSLRSRTCWAMRRFSRVNAMPSSRISVKQAYQQAMRKVMAKTRV